jgi:predicted transcriptional regulator
MPRVKRRERADRVQQLSVFEGLDPGVPPSPPEPAPDTMRQIVSLRMPDALLERVEAAARARGVSPSSLMRAMIAAGLDRSYAAIAEPDLAAELASLRRRIDEIAVHLMAAPKPKVVGLAEPLADAYDAEA